MDDMKDELRPEYSAYQVDLYKAALRGDWDVASKIQQDHPNCFMEDISKNRDIALHIAAAGGRHNFVKQLLHHESFTIEQLTLQNKTRNTAFCLAAASGDVEMVKQMENLDSNLPKIAGSYNLRPILMAALLGHRKMVIHLLPCFCFLSNDERIDLLINTINTDLYDVALKILVKDKSLAIARNRDGLTALYVLAQKTHKTIKSQLTNTGRQCCNIPFSSLWREKQRDYIELELVERLWEIVIQQPPEEISSVLSSPHPRLIFVAIEMGNYEFIVTLMREYPDLIWEIDDENRTIFHAAVQYRQEKIFRHIRQLEGINHLLMAYKHPMNGNNILHLAAILPPLERLNVVSGAALQMQRELLWFQVVEEVVQREYADLKNSANSGNETLQVSGNETPQASGNETPQALFSREHKELREQGEKWMRDTATSCMVVATLVAAVVFQAIFQSPSDKNKRMFWMFVVFDAASLLASTASILTFFAILTSRYAEDDFLISLPLKLMVGLSLLFFSIMTMLITFTVTVAIVFPYSLIWVTIVIFACFTGTFYIWQHFPLLVDMHSSTFGSDYLFCPREELFQD